jgi:hypothetical protein
VRNIDDGLDRLSIRAGMVLAVECFERALARFGVDDPALEHLLDVLWTFPDATDLADWELELQCAAVPGPARRPTGAGAADEIWVGVDPALRQLYEAVEHVGRGNLYGRAEYEVHIPAVRRVLTMAQALGVDVPSADALHDFRWVDTEWAWGRPIPGARNLLKPG